jgi:predicted HicB family RNase H-like nuclease
MPAKPRTDVLIRLDPHLLAAVDERAKRYKFSRNAWIEKALQRVVDMPRQTTTKQESF